MGRSPFLGSIGFAAAVAGVFPALWLAVAPAMGAATLSSLYFVAIAVLYVAHLGYGSDRRLPVTLLSLGMAGAVLATGDSLVQHAIGAASLVSAGRFLLFSTRPLRSLAIEALLLGVGLLAGGLVAGAGPLSIAFAIGCYFLVQSAYFLIGGGPRLRSADAGASFAAARSRLLRLLEEGAVGRESRAS